VEWFGETDCGSEGLWGWGSRSASVRESCGSRSAGGREDER
jgi:hypothetical protein